MSVTTVEVPDCPRHRAGTRECGCVPARSSVGVSRCRVSVFWSKMSRVVKDVIRRRVATLRPPVDDTVSFARDHLA
jgi:hypothetical protein